MPAPTILRHVEPEFHTDRLLLRCPREGDGRLVHEAVVESRDELRALEGILRNDRITPGGVSCNTCVYAMVRDEG